MNLKEILSNSVAARRTNEMKHSRQLMLIELILGLESIQDKSKDVCFDVAPHIPRLFNSWRGAYEELALGYANEPINVELFLYRARKANGQTYMGYKGGEYTMGRNTPIWVANYGDSESWDDKRRGLVGVEEHGGEVVLNTEIMEYLG